MIKEYEYTITDPIDPLFIPEPRDSKFIKANPYRDGSSGRFTTGSGANSQSTEYPTKKSNPELAKPLKDYVVAYPDGFGHKSINGILRDRARGIEDNLTPEAQKELNGAIGSLDKLVNLSPPLSEPTTVYRGVNWTVAQGLQDKGVGATFTENGFTSVSLSKDIAAGFPSRPTGNLMEIVLPKGTKAISPSKFFGLSKIGDTELTKEKELILGRGFKFEILSIEDSPVGVGNLFKVGVKQ